MASADGESASTMRTEVAPASTTTTDDVTKDRHSPARSASDPASREQAIGIGVSSGVIAAGLPPARRA